MTRRFTLLAHVSLLALGAGLAGTAMADEFGTVLSRSPSYAQVAVPEQQCFQQPQWQPAPTSGAGGVIGALVGGGLGNAIGHGGGRALATGVGVVAGALMGDRVEANNTPAVPVAAQQCQTVTHYESRLVGYDVEYSYNGHHYSARVASDPGGPGAFLPLNVDVSAANAVPVPLQTPSPAPLATQPVVTYTTPAPMVYTAPPVVYGPAPMAFYGAPMYVGPSVGLSIEGGWRGGYHHWR